MTNSINSRSSQKRRVRRPTTAEKVLDAPGVVDDYCELGGGGGGGGGGLGYHMMSCSHLSIILSLSLCP